MVAVEPEVNITLAQLLQAMQPTEQLIPAVVQVPAFSDKT
jgi:hypothetical protein